MKFSLITVTMGRDAELARLKASLAGQTFRDFEHIVIDQRVETSTRGSLSRARNLALSRAKGEIVAFPDDDAWYQPDTLERVAKILSGGSWDGVSFRVTDEYGAPSAGGWMSQGSFEMSRRAIWHTAVSCSFFVKRGAIGNVRFDETLGAGGGTRFGSGEETDFILRLLASGAKILYDGSQIIGHPRFAGVYTMRRGWHYGNGCGRVLRKHAFGFPRLFWMASAQCARALQSIALFKFRKASFHLAMAAGRIAGYFAGVDAPSSAAHATRGASGRQTALLHYWLTGVRGGEKVLAALAEIYPGAVLYTHAYLPDRMEGLFDGRNVKESFIASLPLGRKHPQMYLPLMPLAARRLDLSDCDLIVSSESGPVKGIRKRADQRHICYCHTPMRYLWDMYGDYYRSASLPGKCAMKLFTPGLRKADLKSADSVDLFVANSLFVKERIKRIYGRDAIVIHPPVDVETIYRHAQAFHEGDDGKFYLVAGQMVGYKRVDIAIEACARMGKRLVVAGTGPLEKQLRMRYRAFENIVFEGRVGNQRLFELYSSAKALLFPGVEDFGIVPVEAQAAGTPVIAFARGGALESVQHGKTGLFFNEQTCDSLCSAIEDFEAMEFDSRVLIENAMRFSRENFIRNWKSLVDGKQMA